MRVGMLLIAPLAAVVIGGCATQDGSLKPARDYQVTAPITPMESAIIASDERPWQEVSPGVRRKVYFNDRLTMALIEITDGDKRPAPPAHHHPHDQIGYVLEGRGLVTLGDQTREIGPGGVYVVTSNMIHGVKPLTPRFVLVEAFTPTREDFRAAQAR